MEKHTALQFHGPESLVNFVRQYNGSLVGPFEVLACASKGGTHSLLVLSKGESNFPRNKTYKPAQAYLNRARDTVTFRKEQMVVAGRRLSDRLVGLVGPTEGSSDRGQFTIFWTEDEDLFQRLVTVNLSLGCDRLQVCTLSRKGAAAYLIRADRPAFYAVQMALESPKAKVYTSLVEGSLWVPWGCGHPLASLYLKEEGSSIKVMDSVGISGQVLELENLPWEDAYSLTEFYLSSVSSDQVWSEGEEAARFQIPLTLGAAANLRETSLWVIPEKQQGDLERLLMAIPEQALSDLYFSVHEAPDGERFFFIRERIGGQGRQYISFQGEEFAPYAGYPTLLLPSDMTLRPPLRKDRYRKVFNLQPGEIVLVRPSDKGPQVFRVSNEGFIPLQRLVDYKIFTGESVLQRIFLRSVFNFSRYESAPRRTEAPSTYPPPPRIEAKQVGVSSPKRPPVQRKKTGRGEKKGVKASDKLAFAIQETVSVDESALMLRQDKLEEALVTSQSVKLWVDLSEVKIALLNPQEGVQCLREAIWLSFRSKEDPAPLEGRMSEMFQRSKNVNLWGKSNKVKWAKTRAEVEKRGSMAGWLWVWMELAPTENPSGWISEGYRLMDLRSELSLKDQWLLWGKLCSQSGDKVQEVKVRETLLEGMTREGLQIGDVPGFIQNRLFQSRLVNPEADSVDLEAAVKMLKVLEEEIEKAKDPVVGHIGRAILAYGYRRLGAETQAISFFQRAEASYNKDTTLTSMDRAWISVYLAAAAELKSLGSGEVWVAQCNHHISDQPETGLQMGEFRPIMDSIFERTRIANPTKLFSPENFRTFFMGREEFKYTRAIQSEIESLIQSNDFQGAFDVVERSVREITPGKYNDRGLAHLTLIIAHSLRKMGRAAEGVRVLQAIEAKSAGILGDTKGGGRSPVLLYINLFWKALAEGYADLGDEVRGMEILSGLIKDAGKMVWLDLLDFVGSLLGAVESVPLASRPDPARNILALLALTKEKTHNNNDRYRSVKARLLDHYTEVALSKEKFSQRRSRNYFDGDEYLTRDRIVRETPSEG